MELTEKDLKKLEGVHPHLREVVFEMRWISVLPFMVYQGLRSLGEQERLYRAGGTTWTLASRHLDGHAVDLLPLFGGKPSYAWPMYFPLARLAREAAQKLKIPLIWGGTWKRLDTESRVIDGRILHPTRMDGAHFELPKEFYPSAPRRKEK